MKLKYYLRGLGLGIVIAAAVFSATGRGQRTMTDSEIRMRAAELGMVEETSVLGELASTANGEETEPDSMEETGQVSTEEESYRSESVQDPETQTDQRAFRDEEPAGAPEEETTQTQERDTTDISAADTAAENTPAVGADTVTVVIRSGDSSESVSKRLEEAGLVSSASAYNQYLCGNGYDKRLAAGSHEIPVGATEEEIARALTRN